MAIFENKVLTRYIADTSQERAAIDSLIQKNEQLKNVEKQAAIERERHFDQLVLDISRAARAEESLEDVMKRHKEQSRQSMGELVGLFGKVAGGIGMVIGAAQGLEAVIEEHNALRDQYIELTNQALKFADATHSANVIIEEQATLAHKLGAPLNDTMQLYDGVLDAVQELNYSHREQLKLTEELGKAAVIEGKGIDSAGEFMHKLSITMASGADASNLMRGLMLEMPVLADQWIEKYGGSQASFLKMVSEGKVTFNELVDTIVDGNGKVDESFAKRGRTSEQWHTEVTESYQRATAQGKNYVEVMIAGFDQANKPLVDNRITVKEWTEDVIANLSRVEDKVYSSIRDAFANSIASAEKSISHFGEKIGTAFEKFLTKGSGGLREMVDPWYNGKTKTKDEIQGFIEFDNDDMSDDVRGLRDKRKEKARAAAEKRRQFSNQVAKKETDELLARLQLEASQYTRESAPGTEVNFAGIKMPSEKDFEDLRANLRQLQADLAPDTETRRLSFLESTFGAPEEFDIYKGLFDGLSNAVGGTYEALISGSEPAGKAFKKMIADSLMAIGKQSSVKALQELAYAAGSFAFGNVGAGALHLKAAGLHGAVAIAAGAAAHSIGTSAQVAAADKAEEEKKKEEEKAKKRRPTRSAGKAAEGLGAPTRTGALLSSRTSIHSPKLRRLSAVATHATWSATSLAAMRGATREGQGHRHGHRPRHGDASLIDGSRPSRNQDRSRANDNRDGSEGARPTCRKCNRQSLPRTHPPTKRGCIGCDATSSRCGRQSICRGEVVGGASLCGWPYGFTTARPERPRV
jgi:tape measure domain-containing protein